MQPSPRPSVTDLARHRPGAVGVPADDSVAARTVAAATVTSHTDSKPVTGSSREKIT